MPAEFIDHSDEAKAKLEKNIGKALTMIGLKWREVVTKEITDMRAVDTGRLRGSMTSKVDTANRQVIAGTNVEYAPYVNYGTSRMPARPFMENSVINYKDDYKEIVASVLGEGFGTTAK